MRILSKCLLSLALILGCIASSPVSATSGVAVDLRLANPTYYAVAKTCRVHVPAGSNGIAVLDAAKAAGCIGSYSTTTYSIGTFVSCIDNICGDPAPTYLRYWVMRANTLGLPSGRRLCEPTSYGVDGYSAVQGAELSFTFENWVTGSAPTLC